MRDTNDPRLLISSILSIAFPICLLFFLFLLSGLVKWIVVGIFIVFVVRFFYRGIREIPSDPPFVGILTVLRKRRKIILEEGFRFFPGYPWLTDFIPVEVTKINQDLPEQIVRTPDRGEVGIEVSITWQPEYRDPQMLINFLNSGGREKVGNILEDIVQDRLRAWALSDVEGPVNWQEVMAASDEAVAILLKTVLGDVLEPIPYFPTSVLLKYYNNPQISPSQIERKKWGKDWSKLKTQIEQLETSKQQAIIKAVEKRKVAIMKAKTGNGSFVKSSLGIIVNRFTINQIRLKGKLAGVAEQQALQVQLRNAEKVELDHIRRRLRELANEGLSREDAIQVIQVERNKATMDIKKKQLSISPGTMEVIQAIADKIFNK